MSIDELDEELKSNIDNLYSNWEKNENIEECFPKIVAIALNDFRASIIEYLKNSK